MGGLRRMSEPQYTFIASPFWKGRKLFFRVQRYEVLEEIDKYTLRVVQVGSELHQPTSVFRRFCADTPMDAIDAAKGV
jgi:hypothetical protein